MKKDNLEKVLNELDLTEAEQSKVYKAILTSKEKINLMITGATGSGKSSTINALFNSDKAKVGEGVNPETMDIQKYELGNLNIWDTPGLGDGKEKDIQHSQNIEDKLNEKDSDGNALIDLVLVILDGGSKDLGTSYELINQVIIPNLGKNPHKRILIAVNQADMAMKGRYWNHTTNLPEKKLEDFLEEKVKSVKRRVKEATNVNIEPIYYSAGFKEDGEEQNPYNLSKLLSFIIDYTPKHKRIHFVKEIKQESIKTSTGTQEKAYQEKINRSFTDVVVDVVVKVVERVVDTVVNFARSLCFWC